MEILIGLKNSALRGGQISEVERNQVWSENGMLTPELLNREQLFPPTFPPLLRGKHTIRCSHMAERWGMHGSTKHIRCSGDSGGMRGRQGDGRGCEPDGEKKYVSA